MWSSVGLPHSVLVKGIKNDGFVSSFVDFVFHSLITVIYPVSCYYSVFPFSVVVFTRIFFSTSVSYI